MRKTFFFILLVTSLSLMAKTTIPNGSGGSVSILSPDEQVVATTQPGFSIKTKTFVYANESGREKSDFATMQITIENSLSSAQTWTLNYTRGYGDNLVEINRDFTVASGQVNSFIEHLPTTLGEKNFNYRFIGYGLLDHSDYHHSENHSSHLVFPTFYESIHYKQMDLINFDKCLSFVNNNKDLHFSWQGLSSFSHIYMSPKDWLALSQKQQSGLKDWIFRGGILHSTQHDWSLVGSDLSVNESSSLIAMKRDLQAKRNNTHFGQGQILIKNRKSIIHGFKKLKGKHDAHSYKSKSSSNSLPDFNNQLKKKVSSEKINTALAALILLAFAILIGPINLLVFAGKKKRLQLLITTPLISIGASLFFFVIIILKDGFGGNGHYSIFTWTDGQNNKTLISQSQVSETGLMSSSSPALPQASLVQNYRLEKRRKQVNISETSFQINNNFPGKGWFPSNSRRLQQIDTIQASRANLEFIAKDTPAIRSNYPMNLNNILICDNAGKLWTAKQCLPGQELELKPMAQDLKKFYALHLRDNKLEKWLNKRIKAKQAFYIANSDQAGDFLIQGHKGIDWQADTILIGGEFKRGQEI